MGLATDALKFIGKNVASGALSAVGGDAAGWILNAILGGNGQDQQIAQLGQQLDSIQQTLQEVQNELNTIESQLQQIAQQQLYQAWETQDVLVQQYITQITTQYERYVTYAQNPKSTSASEVDELISDILSTNNGAEISLNELNTLVVGAGQEKGVLQLWALMVAPLIASGKMNYAAALSAYMTYYLSIAGAQLRAANLLVEAYNAQNNNPVAQTTYNNYRDTMGTQEVPFVQNVDVLVYQLSSSTTRTYDSLTAWQTLFAGGALGANYSPSEQHYTAEEILANAQAMKPDERRIVVWMIVLNIGFGPWQQPGHSIFPHVDYGTLTVQIATANNTQISPDSSSYIDTIQDRNGNWQSIRRLVYTTQSGDAALSDGNYQLVDMNNESSLPPLPYTSGMGPTYFQHQMYLSYNMHVDVSQQFDFMDFAIYAMPYGSAC